MTWLVARAVSEGRWAASVEREWPQDAHRIPFDPDDGERKKTATISRVVENMDDRLWQLEIAANLAKMDCGALLAGQQLAAATRKSHAPETLALDLGAADPTLSLAAARTELGENRRSIASAIGALAAAALLAPLLVLWLILRHGGHKPSALGRRDSVLLAVHGEDTTRTRHVSALFDEVGDILLLGRPTSRTAKAAQHLSVKIAGREIETIRPLSLGAWARAFPDMMRRAVGAAKFGATFGLPMARREIVAISYRCAQGAVHGAWWRMASSHTSATTCLFAHTGTADTSELELAMHASGVQTVHIAHGTNPGWSFAALSNIGIFQSGHDAELAASLPAYGRTTYIVSPPPEPTEGNDRWALLTSYTHLDSAAYRTGGAAADCSVVDMVSKAAAQLGKDPSLILWRPHPQIEVVAESERARLLAAVEQAGFSRWPADLDYQELGHIDVVVTTPSTVATDALRAGRAPIIAIASPLQNDLVYAHFPFCARSPDELAQTIRAMKQRGNEDCLRSAWTTVRPGGRLDRAAIEAILR